MLQELEAKEKEYDEKGHKYIFTKKLRQDVDGIYEMSKKALERRGELPVPRMMSVAKDMRR